MTPHGQILKLLRDSVAKDPREFQKYLVGIEDEKVLHKIFHSYRGKDAPPKGMRLSSLGYRMLGTYVKSYEINMPEGYRLGSRDLLYLDARAKMPYYIGRGEDEDGSTILVVFEAQLGILLKLADGMISNLRDMEA